MNISLCLLVKDEERTIVDCLAPIRDLFDDVRVMDTGSTDRTCELLRERFGITPDHGRLDERQCYSKFEARNQLIAKTRHPWILFLDADERIARNEVSALLDAPDDPDASGYFCPWDTYINGAKIEDYKLSLFRREVRYSGLVHENTQQHMRRRGLTAAWREGMKIDHYPEAAKLAEKRPLYRSRLQCALAHDDTWYRYHWFMGYTLYNNGEMEEAGRYLAKVIAARPRNFPVECLNSHLVLARMHAVRGDTGAMRDVVRSAREFYGEMADDFEVRVNFRLKPWLDRALAACRDGRPDLIQIYNFAC